jgi:CRISPR/Cas system CSM-associated protein Csm3 (group 7 of RAMP superfamily)
MSNYTHRYTARVLVEATTPLKIGTGDKGITIDEMIATDANGLPTIPGTAIAGVLRHLFEKETNDSQVFGFQKGSNSEGSRFIFSEARFVGKEGKVLDGLQIIDFTTDDFYNNFKKLAVREHTKINHQGVADSSGHGKFDSQVVYKGSRFVFDIEFLGNEEDLEIWNLFLTQLNSPMFRLGGSTRKGFGELEIKAIDENIFDLRKDLDAYLNRSVELTIPENSPKLSKKQENFIKYQLELTADDFFLFSSGYGDNEVDAIAKKEKIIVWKDGKPEFSEEKILIPATSVKGALSHRTAFYYNKLAKNFAEEVDNIENYVEENNTAVKILFGYKKDSKKEQTGEIGKVLISDVFIDHYNEKIFNHVAIDRFTGGAIDGALFDEKAINSNDKILLNIFVDKVAFEKEEFVQESFESALKDITTGMLPLGGSVNKGHGCFSGKIKKDGGEI